MKIAYVDPNRPDRVQVFIKDLHNLDVQNSTNYVANNALPVEPLSEPVPVPAPQPPASKKSNYKSRLKKLKSKRKLNRPVKKRTKAKLGTDFYKPTNGVAPLDDSVDEIIFSGVLRGCDEIIKKAMELKTNFWYLDNGYLGKFFRVSYNSTCPTQIIEGPPRYDHKIELMPWRGGHGKDIIILPPSEHYRKTFGIENFLQNTVDTLAKITNKNIIIRPKIADTNRRSDWDRQIENAYCVISWGSALCIDAMIKGIPTISLGNCPTKSVSFKMSDLETKNLYKEPNRMELINSLTWYNYDYHDFASAYKILNEKLLGKIIEDEPIPVAPTVTF